MTNSDKTQSSRRSDPAPTPGNTASQPTTSTTIGYDSAQKSGYDTEQIAHEARRTVNEVEQDAQTTHRDRAEDESKAHEVVKSKKRSDGS